MQAVQEVNKTNQLSVSTCVIGLIKEGNLLVVLLARKSSSAHGISQDRYDEVKDTVIPQIMPLGLISQKIF